MARSHPPTLITSTERTIRDEIQLDRGAHVLVGVSGGADSMALLSVLARIAVRRNFQVSAHGVDHGLRPEARAELDVAEAYARELGVAFSRSELSIVAGSNLQARAREARYEALRSCAARLGANWIATAHHADDRAETVLMRLLRGTSPAGLAVLPARNGDLIRPLIRARKNDVLAHVERHRIPFVEDPSNRDQRFLRVRVRTELMPVLTRLSPRIVEHLNALADELGRARDPVTALERELALGSSLLGTAQRTALRQMIERRSRSARVRLKDGKELHWDAATGSVVVGRAPGARVRHD